MQTTEQIVKHYARSTVTEMICEDMRMHIEQGWRVSACFERDRHVVVVYERKLGSWQ